MVAIFAFQVKEFRLFVFLVREKALRPLADDEFIFDVTTQLDRVRGFGRGHGNDHSMLSPSH